MGQDAFMSAYSSRTMALAIGLTFLAAGCQPAQNTPLELRAPVAPEETPDLSEYEVETLPDLSQSEITAETGESTDTAGDASETETVSPVVIMADNPEASDTSPEITLAQVITPAPEPAQPPQPAPPPQLEPATLVGNSPDQLHQQLGTPDYIRKEGETEIWQYRLGRCVVNFILADKGEGKRIAAWIGRHRILGLTYDHDACIRDLAEREQL